MSIRPRKRVETKISQIKAYETIVRPLITEKRPWVMNMVRCLLSSL